MSSAGYISEGEVRLTVPEHHKALTLILPGNLAVIIGEALGVARESGMTDPIDFPDPLTDADLNMVADQVIDAGFKFGRALALLSRANRERNQQDGVPTVLVEDEEIEGTQRRSH